MNFDSHFLVTVSFAFMGGIFPAIVWLLFWTREDKKNPEPKSMLAFAFIGGVVAVFVSLLLEKYFYGLGFENLFASSIFNNITLWFENLANQANVTIDKIFLVIIFAPFIEEISKFIMAYIFVLRSKDNDEPLDPMIYMITTALGFAAIENMLFLITGWNENHNIILSVFTGNMRFVGSMLLHTISSATIAIFMSFCFFDKKIKKIFFLVFGIICSVTIHSAFNFFMIRNQGTSIHFALVFIWIIVIIVLLIFERIKKIGQGKICELI